MTILEMCDAGEQRCVNVPRLDWLAVLAKATSGDPVEAVMIHDLTAGAESIDVEYVMCERAQVRRVCEIVGVANAVPGSVGASVRDSDNGGHISGPEVEAVG